MDGADYAAVLGVWVVAITAPGPDVVLILRESVRHGRRNAVAAAAGVVVGVAIWLALAMAGAHLLLEADQRVLGILQLLGGAYLVFLGAGALRAAKATRAESRSGGALRRATVDGAEPTGADPAPFLDGDVGSDVPGASEPANGPAAAQAPVGASFRRGALTNLSNPKALVFFGTVFSVLVPADTSAVERVGLSAVLVLVAAGWFTGLARFATSARVGGFLGRHAAGFDAVAGLAFVALGGLALLAGAGTLSA